MVRRRLRRSRGTACWGHGEQGKTAWISRVYTNNLKYDRNRILTLLSAQKAPRQQNLHFCQLKMALSARQSAGPPQISHTSCATRCSTLSSRRAPPTVSPSRHKFALHSKLTLCQQSHSPSLLSRPQRLTSLQSMTRCTDSGSSISPNTIHQSRRLSVASPGRSPSISTRTNA